MKGRQIVVVFGILMTALSGCLAHSKTRTTGMMALPADVGQDALIAPEVPQAQALTTVVTAYLHHQYRIEEARFFKANPLGPWNSIAKDVANRRSKNGAFPARPDWHRTGLDLIDLYPRGGKKRLAPFAVAMARDKMPDGMVLVGYFALSEAAR